MDAQFWINQLQLQPHPEGGFFREVFQSSEVVPSPFLPKRYDGDRAYYSSIYFLLEQHNFSAFHRLQTDEIWHFYAGSPLTIWIIDSTGQLSTQHLGNNPALGQCFQVVVPANTWFAAKPDHPSYSLVGCTMAPGFHYDDFELADSTELSTAYPQHRTLIEELTRDPQCLTKP